ncbi:MAG: 16S rRNA (cytidine(1402)-2'-O)-methyltransferase [Bowdeniella nasicola]|nr:16S rRNA (cytidine(1402)-2'-O)-methyltransferase [Bowdeniella nasicola]
MSCELGVGITLAATPIGNLADASPRLRAALRAADVIAAEDTRRVRQLASALEITLTARVVSYHDHNERTRLELLLREATTARILVVSDAGMPTIADPGYRLVAAAHQAGVAVRVIPGPSAPVAALAAAGLATDSFTFLGFLARKGRPRATQLAEIATSSHTTIIFESPTRLAATLADLVAECGGEREAAVCRELTKMHEEVRRAPLSELASWAQAGIRGEIVIVIAPAPPVTHEVDPALVAEVRALADLGLRLKVAAQHVAARTGVRAKSLFEAAHH